MKRCSPKIGLFAILGTLFFLAACGGSTLDHQLATVISGLGLEPLDPGKEGPVELVQLGEALFFDKVLSGNRDIACATCHHPLEHGGDGLSLPVGTGGTGLGSDRLLGEHREFVPRNSPEIFNRGAAGWVTMFWDGRIAAGSSGMISPAGDALPGDLDGVLAAQAMFPVTSRDEMRGAAGDRDVDGRPNELANIPDEDLPEIWRGLMDRLLHVEEYVELFAAAYPERPIDELGFEHAAIAIAAYEAAAFAFADSPWDAYLAGDEGSLDEPAKRGAVLFYGEAGCSLCHAGTLFTDQRFHNVGVPQLGPGKGEAAPSDLGRSLISGSAADDCAFRTPPLRNVTLTGPWMHTGAYTDLESVVRHMAAPASRLRDYDPTQLDSSLRETVVSGPEGVEAILANLDPLAGQAGELSDSEVNDLLAFLASLTDPAAADLSMLIPESVPSGLPVDR